MTISEKSAYLKGLMDGLKLDTETNEGKMIAAIVDLLGDMSKRMVDIEDTTIAISDELDEIEEDLDAIEDFILDEDDEDDWDEDEDDEEDAEDDSTMYEVTCPNCGQISTLDEETLMDPEGDLVCPHCGATFDIELEGTEDDSAEETDKQDQ